MKTFVFRNQTVEAFLGYDDVSYSGYDDISLVPHDADRYIWFYQVPVNADSNQLAQEIASFTDKLDLVLSSADSDKPFIIFSLVNLFPLKLTGDDMAVDAAIAAFNDHVLKLAASNPRVKWVDLAEFTSRYDADTLINWKFYLMSQTLLNPKLAKEFQAWWVRIQDELELKRKKCLVLDLDNTLWGGVLGEDGVDGIQLGGDYPGKAFSYWQRALLQLSRYGVILAVCSKNNREDVEEVWKINPHMVLKRENFAALRINWQDKATNIRELAQELNIGLDSMVFVDDNPAERELIRQMLPQVVVPDFPDKPYQLMPFFKSLVDSYFRIYKVTDEDRAKTEQYRANALRLEEQSRFTDFDDYLYSLDIAIDVIPADEHNLPRIAQMTQKTNQFNLTTHRYSEDDIRNRMNHGYMIYCIRVSDRFGDSGITGTIMLQPISSDEVIIETLLLSCRILGKGIEEAFFKTVLNLMRLEGYREVYASYKPTAKNGQTADFYDRMGFTCVDERSNGTKHYKLALDSVFEIKNCYNIRVL
ncbi:MAG: HAD-IIIC family phosphatase [Muribaculaceae bacterium]|nr:HAD-IIIC family phosphatase [Muribaculaceae bacterium]